MKKWWLIKMKTKENYGNISLCFLVIVSIWILILFILTMIENMKNYVII